MSEISPRSRSLAALTSEPLDVLVIGGGIVGAGIARDAAMRGMLTGLVEMRDFASGTSSRSSRLLHGGLRYLAQGRVGLVREASVEKTILHRIAPHLAEPLPFLFPVYRGDRHWKLWQLKIGVRIYDLLCGGRNLGQSSGLNADEAQYLAPGLSPRGLEGAVRYFDGFTNDARLVLDTLHSAEHHGAALVNYCRLLRADRGEMWQCQVRDEITGEERTVIAQSVVNAAGPWADTVPHSRVKLRLTKGVHVVVDRARLPLDEAVVMAEGPRILFAIPWGQRLILGTTDTDHKGAPEYAVTKPNDVEYVLAAANRFFPNVHLEPADVRSHWAGVRPLIASGKGGPSDISRSHEIRNPETGWWDVAGGKLTTYRLMAEQAVDGILREQKRRVKCMTAREPLLREGETAFCGTLPPPFSLEAVDHCCRHEWVMCLDDVMTRRTSWRHYLPDADKRAEEVAHRMAERLGWSPARRAAELRAYHSPPVP